MPFFAAIFGFLSSMTAKVLLDRLLMFLAIKALLTALFIVVIPIILNNAIHDFMQIVFNTMNQYADTSGLDGAMSFTGLLGWFVVKFRIPECVSMIVSALQLNLILRLIPFSPVR
jgi:hypothetical protein